MGAVTGFPLGANCRCCHTVEAHCARDGGCCEDCTHWPLLDEHGNELLPHGGSRPRRGVACGTEEGYQRHRWLHRSACLPCRVAHSRHNTAERRARLAAARVGASCDLGDNERATKQCPAETSLDRAPDLQSVITRKEA